MSQRNPSRTKVEIGVWDVLANSRSVSFTDKYSITIRDGSLAGSFYYWYESPGPLEIWIRNEELDIQNIPDNVASVMQEYADNSVLNWPNTFSTRTGDVDREEARIEIIKTRRETEDLYKFDLWGGSYVHVFKNDEQIGEHEIPGAVKAEAEQYFPNGIQYASA